jgi:hypothetical protein
MCHFEIQNLTNMSVHPFANTIALDAVTTLRLADVNWSALKIAAKQGLRSSFQGGKELALSGVDFARNLTISSRHQFLPSRVLIVARDRLREASVFVRAENA